MVSYITNLKFRETSVKNVHKLHKQNTFFCTSVLVDRDHWMEISFKSRAQSGSSAWHKERFIRITASSRAHGILTRQSNFENLAQRFVNMQSRNYSTVAMRYGLETEKEARLQIQSVSSLIVEEVGLIISMKQPWLGCSPDGMIRNEDQFELLEIKCPYSCKDGAIVDREEKLVYVPHLKFDDNGELQLKYSNDYYTQLQVSMYILAEQVCHFFVYSSADQVHILVHRDENCLSFLITKIENFYFTHSLPALESKL